MNLRTRIGLQACLEPKDRGQAAQVCKTARDEYKVTLCTQRSKHVT